MTTDDDKDRMIVRGLTRKHRPFAARVGAINAYICTQTGAHVLFVVHRAEGTAPPEVACERCRVPMISVDYNRRDLESMLREAIVPANWFEWRKAAKTTELELHKLPSGAELPMVNWSGNVVRDVSRDLKKLADTMSAKLREASEILDRLRLAGVEVDLSVVGGDGEGVTMHDWTGEFSIDYKRVTPLARGES